MKTRVEKLESTRIEAHKPRRAALIVVPEGKTEAEARAEWEAENGALTDDDRVIFIVGFSNVDKK
ncbi:MAG: hypothetical protein ACXWGW_03755 [Methylobacter sp.]